MARPQLTRALGSSVPLATRHCGALHGMGSGKPSERRMAPCVQPSHNGQMRHLSSGLAHLPAAIAVLVREPFTRCAPRWPRPSGVGAHRAAVSRGSSPPPLLPRGAARPKSHRSSGRPMVHSARCRSRSRPGPGPFLSLENPLARSPTMAHSVHSRSRSRLGPALPGRSRAFGSPRPRCRRALSIQDTPRTQPPDRAGSQCGWRVAASRIASLHICALGLPPAWPFDFNQTGASRDTTAFAGTVDHLRHKRYPPLV